MHLLRALRTVSRVESSPTREAAFQDIASRSRAIRSALGLHRLARKFGISHYLTALYGVFYFSRAALPGHAPRWIATVATANEIRQLDEIDALMQELKPIRVRYPLINPSGWLALAGALPHLRKTAQLMRLFKRLEAPLGFMPACRVAMTLFLYARFRRWLLRHPVRAVLVLSDYSPDAVALATAASAQGIRRIYRPHALPSDHSGARNFLSYEAYIFDSKAMYDRFSRLQPIRGQVVYRGLRGAFRPMRLERLAEPGLRIGIFLSGAVDLRATADSVRELLELGVSRILIRGHPVALINPDFSILRSLGPKVTVSQGTTLEEDAAACDLVIGGNTTAYLEVVKHGVPAVYLPAMDRHPYDYNGLVRDGLIPVIASVSALDLKQIQAFYAPPWASERLAYFDESHRRDPEEVRRAMHQALTDLLEA